MDPKKTEAKWLTGEATLMEKAKTLFGTALCDAAQGYILSEETGDESDDPMYTIFVGRMEQLNLYQIWYNHTNKTQLNVVAAFVPIVRIKPEGPEMIPKHRLKVGAAYEVEARNFDTAIWDGKVFRGVRFKMGSYFMDTEQHWDDDDHFGTVKPLRRLE